jgi:hypothetical protein
MVSLLYFTASGAVVNKAMHKAMLESYLVLVGLMLFWVTITSFAV